MWGRWKDRDVLTPFQFIGFPSVQREFYVPVYDAEVATKIISGTVDHRHVLYWKSLMQTNSLERSQLRFPLSDGVRTLRAMIQRYETVAR